MGKSVSTHDLEASSLVELLRWRAQTQATQRAYTFLQDGATEEAHLTYSELDLRAKAIAAELQAVALPGSRALLLFPPGLDYIAAYLGCLYAGIVVVPAYPARRSRSLPRLLAIVEDAGAALALTTGKQLRSMERQAEHAPELRTLRWVATDAVPDATAQSWRQPHIERDSLAFLQYTSGSTATPKGVMVSHGNLLHNLGAIATHFGVTSASRGVIWLPPYHDMGLIGGVLQPLYSGVPVTLMSPTAMLQHPLRWLHAITRFRATISGGPNFAYDLCVARSTPEQRATLDLSFWEVAFTGAEPINPATLDRFADAFASCGFRREAFYPCYGLAEATLLVSGGTPRGGPSVRYFSAAGLEQHRVVDAQVTDAESRALAGCGLPLPDQSLVVVDPATSKISPVGTIGEIWVRGPSVAQGYWSRPDETARDFQAMLADTGDGPFLRTGDLGFIDGGELFITGRLKDLIIVRGRNHYPQDIERTIEGCHPVIRVGSCAAFAVTVDDVECLVIVQEVDHRQPIAHVDVFGAIREVVGEVHAVQPHAIVLVRPGGIPRTSSGKLRRRACRDAYLNGSLDMVAEWYASHAATRAMVDGEEPCETGDIPLDHEAVAGLLAAMLADLVKVGHSEIDLDQPITRYGIDSLGAIRLVHAVETRLGRTLPLDLILQGQSLNDIAAKFVAPSSERPVEHQTTASADRHPVQALSHGQRALWFLHRLAPHAGAGNIAQAVRITGSLDTGALRRAFVRLIDRHAVLRATFTSQDGEPVQAFNPHPALQFDISDGASLSASMLDEHLVEAANQPFDLQDGPLARVAILRRSTEDAIVLLVIHHIAADLWTLALLVDDLSRLYAAEQSGIPADLPVVQSSYTDFVRWQADMLAGPIGAAHWSYWRTQLAGDLPVLELPTDRPRPLQQTFRGATHVFTLDPKLAYKLRMLAEHEGATTYMVLLAAFQVLLHRYSGQDDILVGSPTAGRSRAAFAQVAGYFVNPIVLRAGFDGDPDFRTFLRQVRQTVVDGLAHQDFPLPLLVERLQPARDASRSPMFQAMFALQTTHDRAGDGIGGFSVGANGVRLELADLTVAPYPFDQRVAQFDLSLTMAETGDGFGAALQYNADLFDTLTAARMMAHFETLLAAIVAAPDRSVGTLPLLTDAERRTLAAWNATEVDLSSEPPLVARIEAQAARAPDALALVDRDRTLTYGELNRRANQLANYVQSLGVGAETLVAVYCERSLDMVVGQLAVLKAGGAFLPIDPAYPSERVAFMLADSRAAVLLTQRPLVERLPVLRSPLICLDDDPPAFAHESVDNLGITVTPETLAYVIYTSGSTGKPKGVMIEHHGLINLLRWHHETYDVTAADRATQLAGPAFDASMLEIWPSLAAGASVYIVPDDIRAQPQHLVRWMIANRITLAFVPTALAETLIDADWPTNTPLRALLTGGDTLHRAPRPSLPFRLVNHYGPTEITVLATSGPVAPTEAGPIAIGRPILNTAIFVLDQHCQPVPIGVPGELYISGAGLARGYLNRPALTAERFIDISFNDEPGRRLYRTGDLVRSMPDGSLEFLGRTDFQVKIRGFRIELGEIETTLLQHSGVHAAAVLTREERPGHKRLVAYVVLKESMPVTPRDLRRHLLERLPDYMVPAFVVLPALPQTPNGKLDRRALETISPAEPEQDTTFVAPRDEVEVVVAGIWCEILGLAQVNIHDDFFELGGHSLLATQIVARVSATFAIDLPLSHLFVDPTVAGVATAVRRVREASAVERIPVIGDGNAQRRLLYDLDRLSDADVDALLSQLLATEEIPL